MSINKSQKHISGRDIIKKWEQKWGRPDPRLGDTYANWKKCSLGLDIVLLKLIDAFYLTATEGKDGKGRQIIIHRPDDFEDHIFGVEEYLFDQEEVERLENEDPELILEYMIDSEIIDACHFPKERDPQEESNRLKRRLANITAILNRKGLSSQEKIYLKQKKEDLTSDVEEKISRLNNKAQKTKRPRTKVPGQIYIAAASRAEIVLLDQIQAGRLPATKPEKLKVLKMDKQFQKILAALPTCPGDKYLMRKLNEAKPGLWQLGKAINKKYRKKSTYSS